VTSERRRAPGEPPVKQASLFDEAGAVVVASPAEDVSAAPAHDPDGEARAYAVDPAHNVVLEASAGTGKTSVLVSRYVNLLKAGVDPANILAITFTRKAAAEMRERILGELRTAAERSAFDKARWAELRDRLGEIAISTIDAFCLSLLREFPLEADVDPGFDLADDTEVPRLMRSALDRTLRTLVALARTDADVELVLAQLGIARTRQGLAALLSRRLVAVEALDRFVDRGPCELTAAGVCRQAAYALREAIVPAGGSLASFLADGPAGHPRYELFLREVEALNRVEDSPEAALRGTIERVAAHFLTKEGAARKAGAIPPYAAEHYPPGAAARRHRDALFQIAPRVEEAMFAFHRDLNVVLARGIRRMFAVARTQYRQALEERSVLDFSDVLERALGLLRRMDEFSQSRFRLESRYQHVLVDEFQDTSRAQWELVSLLIQAWGEGQGVAASPSIFIVGDRKQSIYRFRDAEVAVLQQASRYIDGLRPGSRARRSIARSFRAVPELQHFVNDLFAEVSQPGRRADDFTYEERDKFPVEAAAAAMDEGPALGVAVADSPEACAAAVADEIARLLQETTVRDKSTGVRRQARPGDIGILFRSRSSHREFERELGARGIPTYVYKGLGFFDADEIKDLTALLRFLADPSSSLRAAAFLRSRIVRLSDTALALLSPDLSAALLSDADPPGLDALDPEDRAVLLQVRGHLPVWLERIDRVTPAELLDQILSDAAYPFELGGSRRRQAWENVKKMRGLVRRIQNRGYATVRRIAEHLLSLSAGDESNAVIEALDAVNLMTVHASKGLEFPVVFVVNLARGASGPPQAIRLVAGLADEEPSVTLGAFLSETDEAERDRERHETRRLLYVAVTRARDRLYLATPLKEGSLACGRGSLGEVLPPSIGDLFSRAGDLAGREERVGWTGASGRTYQWRLCPPASAAETAVDVALPATEALPAGTHDEFGRPQATESPIRLLASEAAAETGGGRSHRLLGLLVHRLFQWEARLEGDVTPERVATLALQLLGPDELVVISRPGELAAAAARIWSQARTRPDVVQALSGVEHMHEVPFSLLHPSPPARIVRGVIDLLVRKEDGAVAVVEFKTGARRRHHTRQLELYVEAARALHPGTHVEGVLLYV